MNELNALHSKSVLSRSPESFPEKQVNDGTISWDELEACSNASKTTILVRLAGAISIVLLFSVAANSFLNYFSFQKNYQQIIQSKFTAIVEELGFKIESSLNLGLPLSAMAHVNNLLSETSQHHETVWFLVVKSPEGEIYFSTGEPESGLPSFEQGNFAYDEEIGIWVASNQQMTVIGYDLVNSYQKLAGRLLLGYDQNQINYTQKKVALSLARETTIVFTLFIILGCVSLYLIVYKFRCKLSDIERQLTGVASQSYLDFSVSKDIERINRSL